MIEKLIRPHLQTFSPYQSARSEVRHARVLLDANESPVQMAVIPGNFLLNRYPDPFQLELRTGIARRFGISLETVFAGSGSDEVIDLLIRLFCEPGRDCVAILEPTYGMYRIGAGLNNVEAISISLDENFNIDVESILRLCTPQTKLLFLCSPNNPTGNLLDRGGILRLCAELNALIIIDQAYVEFAGHGADLIGETAKHENLLVLRTLSKAWGLAGIRLGYCVGNPAVVSYLLRIKAPYNISSVTQSIACEALRNGHGLDDAIHTIVRERDRLLRALTGRRHVRRIYPSEANFLLIEVDSAAEVYDLLAGKGIIVRRRSEPRLKNCLRVTVGTPAENDQLLAVLEEGE